MIKLGMLVGDRYEVLEKIGTGGMSDVYKARDQKLNRLVAVKVLKQEFSENKNFVSKFRVEAQAAAGLMHPNIVNVYDVGEENGIHYIVMELVEGITLKKYIEKKVRLTTKEAISIAIQVAMGIEAAHNNHIIHRDIKPQNIIISKEGKVKVTDFGIAKAASSNTITSSVMGSVHYTSPEQARGGFSDEKSDIYSMGVTLFEMLTGRVPFNGDTTVSIAIKHIQDPMPAPRQFVPEIPVSVENIVIKCTQKSPDRRYQNMHDMIKDLKHSLMNPDEVIAQVDIDDETAKTKVMPSEVSNQMPVQQQTGAVPMPEVFQTVWEDRVPQRETYADEEDLAAIPNQSKPVKRKNGSTAESAKRTAKQGSNSSSKNRNKKKNSGKSKAGTNTASKNGQTKNISNKNTAGKSKSKKNEEYEYYEDTGYTQGTVNRHNLSDLDYEQSRGYYKDEYDYNPKAERITTILTIVAAIVIGCILLYFAGQATGLLEQSTPSSDNKNTVADDADKVDMPEFVDINVEEVKKALNAVGLGYKTSSAISSQYAKDQVISAALEDGQAVSANDKIVKNTTIVLTVSAGASGTNVPAVVGLSEAEGTASLTREGFVVNKKNEFSPDYVKGTIISQVPDSNTLAAIGSEVTIVISSGSESVDALMPDVLGYSKDAAVSSIEAAGFEIGQIEDSYSDEYPEGQICYQSYVSGTSVAQGTKVDLKVSIGSEVATYSCNLTVQAPADYIGGNAEVILMDMEGNQLWYSSPVTTFPVSIIINGFKSPSAYGIVTISYLKNVEEIVTDADGNQTTQVNPAVAQSQQNVQFTKN